jgi:hypothetical protein
MTDTSGQPAEAVTPLAPRPWYVRGWDLVASEPVAAQGLIQASLSAGMAFGLHLTVEQMGSINVLVAAALAFLLRRSVVPLSKLPASGAAD